MQKGGQTPKDQGVFHLSHVTWLEIRANDNPIICVLFSTKPGTQFEF